MMIMMMMMMVMMLVVVVVENNDVEFESKKLTCWLMRLTLFSTSHIHLQIQMPGAVFIDGQAVLCAKGIKMCNDGSFCGHRCLQFAHVVSATQCDQHKSAVYLSTDSVSILRVIPYH